MSHQAEYSRRFWFYIFYFNITIIAGLFTLLFSRVSGRYTGVIAAATGIIIYTLLVGAYAGVVRAATLGILTLLGHKVGKHQVDTNSLLSSKPLEIRHLPHNLHIPM